jgi:enoyl-CoA hydratase/carnithine racemase
VSPATDDSVLAECADGVLTLTLNRPERSNSLSPESEKRLHALLDEAEDDAGVRVIVLTGAGRHFCPGVDMQRLNTIAGQPLDLSDRRPFHRPYDVSKPMIAAVNGACAGVGIILALMCDLRFASTNAKFATSFAKRGLPAERGVSWLLARAVGPGAAADLLLSGRSFGAAEARSMGLVNGLTEPGDVVAAAQAYAREMAAACSPQAMAVIKRQLRDDLEIPFSASYDRAMAAMTRMAESADFREGVDSYVEKRPPAFGGITTAFNAEDLLDG